MGNKPIHITASERNGKSYGRQAMWDAMRKAQTFTPQDIALASRRSASSVREYIARLMAAQIVVAVGIEDEPRRQSPRCQRTIHKLVRDTGHEAPRLTPDGKPLIESRDQMWRTMKMLSAFTAPDLAIAASTDDCTVSPTDANDYCKHLYRAGYLALLHPGGPQGKSVFKLLPSMNTGPHAPKVQRTKCVFDPNRNAIMWHEEIEP